MRNKHLILTVAALALLCLLPAAAQADPISLTLDTSQLVSAGGTATFMGSLSNGGAPGRFINGASISLDGSPSGFSFDDAAFFTNVPAFLGAGASVGPVNFFDVLVSMMVAPGSYTGSFSVVGGDGADDDVILATQEFTITVRGEGPAPIPEPATMILLGTGLAGAAAAKRRRRRQTDAS